jgi:DNA-binding CsgD family transcriptional regulator
VFVLAARGDWDRASAHVSEAWRAANSTGDRASINFVANASAHLAACRADMEGVVAVAAPIWAHGGAQVAGLFSWPIEYASALIAAERFHEACEVLEGMSAQAEQRQLRSVQAAVARVRGELAAALQNLTLARKEFGTAEALCADGREPFDRARTWLAHGVFLRRLGERKLAAEKLRWARSTFEQLEAKPFFERSANELTACGFAVDRPPTLHSHPRLTPQELAVARLVSAGKTNREVAAQLVLSVKTVGYHLGNIYTKYGLRSRTELAAIFYALPSNIHDGQPTNSSTFGSAPGDSVDALGGRHRVGSSACHCSCRETPMS